MVDAVERHTKNLRALEQKLADTRARRSKLVVAQQQAIEAARPGDGGASNYPPAEPGALFSVSRSKRLEGDADASPAHCAT